MKTRKGEREAGDLLAFSAGPMAGYRALSALLRGDFSRPTSSSGGSGGGGGGGGGASQTSQQGGASSSTSEEEAILAALANLAP